MCPRGCNRDDVQLIPVPMNDIANEIGSSIVLNMLAIGIIIGKTGLVKYETIEDELKSFLQEKNPDLLDKNLQAIKKGIEIGKQYT